MVTPAIPPRPPTAAPTQPPHAQVNPFIESKGQAAPARRSDLEKTPQIPGSAAIPRVKQDTPARLSLNGKIFDVNLEDKGQRVPGAFYNPALHSTLVSIAKAVWEQRVNTTTGKTLKVTNLQDVKVIEESSGKLFIACKGYKVEILKSLKLQDAQIQQFANLNIKNVGDLFEAIFKPSTNVLFNCDGQFRLSPVVPYTLTEEQLKAINPKAVSAPLEQPVQAQRPEAEEDSHLISTDEADLENIPPVDVAGGSSPEKPDSPWRQYLETGTLINRSNNKPVTLTSSEITAYLKELRTVRPKSILWLSTSELEHQRQQLIDKFINSQSEDIEKRRIFFKRLLNILRKAKLSKDDLEQKYYATAGLDGDLEYIMSTYIPGITDSDNDDYKYHIPREVALESTNPSVYYLLQALNEQIDAIEQIANEKLEALKRKHIQQQAEKAAPKTPAKPVKEPPQAAEKSPASLQAGPSTLPNMEPPEEYPDSDDD